MEGEQKMEVERAWETVPVWPVRAHAPWVCASHGQRGSPGEAAGWIPSRSEAWVLQAEDRWLRWA